MFKQVTCRRRCQDDCSDGRSGQDPWTGQVQSETQVHQESNWSRTEAKDSREEDPKTKGKTSPSFQVSQEDCQCSREIKDAGKLISCFRNITSSTDEPWSLWVKSDICSWWLDIEVLRRREVMEKSFLHKKQMIYQSDAEANDWKREFLKSIPWSLVN